LFHHFPFPDHSAKLPSIVNKFRKWRNLALAVVALVIACQAGVSALVDTRRVQGYLVAHLERAFGRPVEVTQLNVEILPRLRLDAEGISVGEDPAFGYEYFLRAEHLSASLRWTGLLRGHFEFGTLSLSRPSLILVRNTQGRWNLEQWLPPAAGNAAAMPRVYGPPPPIGLINRLKKIEIDEGRVDFKNGADKAPFAFTGVSGSVEQVSPGRWELRLEAQPWRSGVELQSTGTMQVRGDLAGTSKRLQPAEISVHWDRVSLADLFRLLHGEDYGVRGVFALDATAKSGPLSRSAGGTSTGELPAGEWTFALQARGSRIHRWDLAERPDNPRVSAQLKGIWNPSAGTVSADELSVEAPQSNFRGTASFLSGASPEMELRVDSAGIQAADLLAWYRAFHPNVAEGVTVEQYFTGAVRLQGWPLQLHEVAFSSRGGTLKAPGFAAPIRIGAMEGGGDSRKLTIEPVRIALDGKSRGVTPVSSKMRGVTDLRNAADIGFTHNFETRSGVLSVDWRVEKIEDLLKLAALFGRQLNHGWELTGASSAALRWERNGSSLPGLWNGRIDFKGSELQAAGLNQPLKFEDAGIEWKSGKRTAQIGAATGFGANWLGEISETGIAAGTEADDQPNWKFQLHADHLNAAELDRWIGPRARPNWLQRLLASLLGGSAPNSAASELLRRVSAEGTLSVDELTVEKLKMKNVQAEGVVRDLKVDVSHSGAQWAGGKVQAKIHAVFSPRPKYDITTELEAINLAELPSAAGDAERLSGAASGTLHLTTEGVGREELLQMLRGKGEVRLRNVEFRGWDVIASVADGAARTGTSRWTGGEGDFTLRDRSITVDDLKLESGREETMVHGTVNFAREAHLIIESASSGRGEKRAAPVSGAAHVLTISGPLDGLKVSVEKPAVRQPAD
jgi:AsmA-like protein